MNASKIYLLTTINVLANSGNARTAAPVDFMTTTAWPPLRFDSDGSPFFWCANGDTIQIGVQ